MQGNFPPELASTPLEDIDMFYTNQLVSFFKKNKFKIFYLKIKFILQTFVVVSRGRDIFRFAATDAMWILDPFNPIRRVAIYVLVHPLFSFFIITTILTNCVLMIMPSSPTVESTE